MKAGILKRDAKRPPRERTAPASCLHRSFLNPARPPRSGCGIHAAARGHVCGLPPSFLGRPSANTAPGKPFASLVGGRLPALRGGTRRRFLWVFHPRLVWQRCRPVLSRPLPAAITLATAPVWASAVRPFHGVSSPALRVIRALRARYRSPARGLRPRPPVAAIKTPSPFPPLLATHLAKIRRSKTTFPPFALHFFRKTPPPTG